MQDNDNPTRQGETSTYVPFDRLLKAREVALVLGVSESRAYALMASGVLPVIRMGKAVRVSERQLERWISQQSSFVLPTENEQPEVKLFPALTSFELSILEARLGLNGDLPARPNQLVSRKSIAEYFGVYREKVGYTESKAMRKIYNTSEYSPLDDGASAEYVDALYRITKLFSNARLTIGNYPTLKQIKASIDLLSRVQDATDC